MPLAEPPPRGGRFGSPLVLSRVHWVRPEMVVEVSYVEWTPDRLLRHVVYLGEREDKPAAEVTRERPMCNDYGNHVDYAHYLAAFSQTRIPVKWPDAIPNLQPRDDGRRTALR